MELVDVGIGLYGLGYLHGTDVEQDEFVDTEQHEDLRAEHLYLGRVLVVFAEDLDSFLEAEIFQVEKL